MRSMTGFGAASVPVAGARVAIEVRSVNHRFLDTRIVLPREYARWEGDLRELVRDAVARGRLELTVSRTAGSSGRVRIDVRQDVARAYVRALRKLKREMKLTGDVDLQLLSNVPDLVHVKEAAADPAREIGAVRRAVREALTALGRERQREGAHLGRDMQRRVQKLERLVRDLRRCLPHVMADLKKRAAERMRRLAGGVDVDPQRLAQEAAILTERADVTEEIVRMGSHLGALKKLLTSTDPVGKRIEFLLQELHREINTVGSKVGDLRVAGLVLDAKAELEKLREQVQNVE
jgi:uncharacterized protein (TIGR00255 family)